MDSQRWKCLRLAVLAALILTGGTALADDRKALSKQLFELGIEEYKAKQYAAAAASMSKAYDLDPQPDTLYALAQAERLANNCKDASKHYQQLLDTTKNEKTRPAIMEKLELCNQILRGEKPKEAATPDTRRDAPTIQIRTVYRTEQRSNKLAIAFYTVGGISLGGAVTMYLLATSTRADADDAQSLDAYDTLYNRSQLLKTVSYVAAGAGVALAAVATIRVIRGGGKKSVRDASIIPARRGAMFAFVTSF